MTVETNGAVSPEDALAYAARIIQDQLQIFVNFEEMLSFFRQFAERTDSSSSSTFLSRAGLKGSCGASGSRPRTRSPTRPASSRTSSRSS
jgi:hypothetical protein